MIKIRFILSILMIQLLFGCTKNNSSKSFINTDNLPIAYIDNSEDNLFYVGIQKKLSIHIINNKKITVKVKIDNGNISNDGLNYFITPIHQGKLSVSIISDNKLIKSYKYRVTLIPDPKARIDNSSTNSAFVSPSSMQNSKSIYAELNCFFEYKVTYEVLSCKMIRLIPGGNKIEIKNDGYIFNKQIRNELNQSLPGDVVIFDNIKVKNSTDNLIRKIPNVTYFVN